jgi:hypothetical protein
MTPIDSSNLDLEDLEDMELQYLDLQSIAVACEMKEEKSIPEHQIKILQSALIKSRNKEKGKASHKGNPSPSSSLGIKNSTSKEPIKVPKDEKKRGRPSIKQLLGIM